MQAHLDRGLLDRKLYEMDYACFQTEKEGTSPSCGGRGTVMWSLQLIMQKDISSVESDHHGLSRIISSEYYCIYHVLCSNNVESDADWVP